MFMGIYPLDVQAAREVITRDHRIRDTQGTIITPSTYRMGELLKSGSLTW
jgi:hypothetical protein